MDSHRLDPVTRTSLLLPLLALAGCGSLDVSLPGRLGTPLLVREGRDGPLVWACDRLGNLTLNGQVLHLPSRSEQARFGLTVVDAGALPPAWRPDHALDGGLLVSALDKGSPLALAGLRPLDRVEAVQGAPVAHPEDLVAALEAVGPEEQVALDVAPAASPRARLLAAPVEGPRDAQVIRVPFLFERRTSSAGGAFGFGPLDALFYWRSAALHATDPAPETGHATYTRRFEWGALMNLVLWQRARLPSGEERSRLRLFWLLSFGDDVP